METPWEQPWEPAEPEFESTENEDWRGEEHPEPDITESWPEDLAGPEYWMYKKSEEE